MTPSSASVRFFHRVRRPVGAVVLAAIGAVVSIAPAAEAATRKPVRQLLESLPVSSSAVEGYTRELFRHWTTTPGGCSTRAAVLIDERKAGEVRGCAVVDG